MRVLHLVTTLDRGGAENQIVALCSGLALRGRVDLTVAYLKGRGELASELLAAGVPVARLGAAGPAAPAGVMRAAGLLRELRPEIVHTHLFKADLLGAALARRCGARFLVSTKHNEDQYLRRAPWQGLGRRAAHAADRVVAITGAVGRFVEDALGLPPGAARVIRYGLEEERWPRTGGAAFRALLGIPGEAPLVVAVARWTRQKGLDVLVEAARSLRDAVPGVRVALVGRGEDEDALRDRVRALGLEETVLFAGFLGDPGPAFLAADVVALPSRWEGFGLSALEALAAGRPVVASAVGGIPEALGDTGRLVPPEDPAALSAALADHLSPAALEGVRSGAAGAPLRERVRSEFSMEAALDAHESLYGELSGRAAPAAPGRRKVRLLLVARAGTGGAARHLRFLLEHLDRGLFEPTVAVSPLEEPRFPKALEEMGARVIPVPMERDPAPLRDLASLRAVRSLLATGEYDLVHAHTSKPGAFARLAARKGGLPVVYTPHGWYFSYAPSAAARSLYLRVERRLAPLTAILHCVCEGEREDALRGGIGDPARIRVIPNAVPAPAPVGPERVAALRASLGIGPGERVALMASRLDAPKDPVALLRAAASLPEGTRVLLAGSGPLLEECRAAAGPRVLLLGKRTDVPDLLALCDVAVLSTRYDACPFFALEAAAAGRPVVAPVEFVPGALEPGLVPFDPEEEGSLAAVLAPLLEPEAAARRASLGAAARFAWEAVFSPPRWIRSVEAMYDDALATAAGTSP